MKIENTADTVMQNVSGTSRSVRMEADKAVGSANSKGKADIKRDKYVPSEKNERAGLYSIECDQNGGQKISFDSHESKSADKTEMPKSGEKENSVEKRTCNTDKAKKEIKRLKEKADRLKQQLLYADGKKAEQLRRQLKNVRRELAGKESGSNRRNIT